MQVQAVAAHPHRVIAHFGPVRPKRVGDVLLYGRELGPDPSCCSHLRRWRGAIGRAADHVEAQPRARIAGAAVRTWRLGLEPVEQAQAQLVGGVEGAFPPRWGDADDRPGPAVVLRPVDDGHVVGGEAGTKIGPIQDAPRSPPRMVIVSVGNRHGYRRAVPASLRWRRTVRSTCPSGGTTSLVNCPASPSAQRSADSLGDEPSTPTTIGGVLADIATAVSVSPWRSCLVDSVAS